MASVGPTIGRSGSNIVNTAYRLDRRTALSNDELNDLHAESIGDSSVEAIIVSGKCPTCEHQVRESLSIVVIDVDAAAPATKAVDEVAAASLLAHQIAVEPSELEIADTVRRPLLMTCHCASEHPGRPEPETFGCGRSWLMDAVFALRARR